ncbi:thioesterase II family protein [Mucilaginibacter oryzae]|nr:alpha/beta fold hydrolase [Mucilaginibacter oryzae]
MNKIKPKLFLIHFAGGSCYSFSFPKRLSSHFEVTSLELPGRGRRVKESLITDFNTGAQDIFNQINASVSNDFFLVYGHSMGALLALAVTDLLEKSGKQSAGMIVSGTPGPRAAAMKTTRYLLGADDFFQEVKKLGGLPEEIFDEPDLLSFYLPILRADFEIAEKNDLSGHTGVKCPVLAIMGSEEETVGEIENWKNFTSNHFEHRVLSGDHFFINNNSDRIADLIVEFYDRIKKNELIK